MRFKVCEKVRIATTAGARRVNENGFLTSNSCGFRQLAIVVAIDCVLPTYMADARPMNNTIVQLCETKELIFIHTNCLEPADKKIELRYFCDGKDVTDSISDETKQNLR